MPFGKYKGRLLRDLPDWYLDWLCALDDLRNPLKDALEKESARRATEARQHDQRIERLPDTCPDPQIADQIVNAGLRTLARRHHPDAGGDHSRMVMVNLCAEWLREQIKRLGN